MCEIQRDFMTKRSRGRNKFMSLNYKDRWIILYEDSLRYYNGSLQEGPGNEKESIYLKQIIIIESVDSGLILKDEQTTLAFQVIHTLSSTKEIFPLYLIAQNRKQKEEWIKLLHLQCEKVGVKLSKRFHPGAWSNQLSYSCCNNSNKASIGCQPTRKYRADIIESGQFNVNRPLPNLPTMPSESSPSFPLQNGKKEEISSLNHTKNIKSPSSSESSSFAEEGFELLLNYDWFHPNLTRLQSEDILVEDGRDGCFLVRPSLVKPNSCSLSIFTREKPGGLVKHYHIKKNNAGRFYLSDKFTESSISDLVDYHTHNSGGLYTRLRHPISRYFRNNNDKLHLLSENMEIPHDNIEILNKIGSGQFGQVYRARFYNSGRCHEVAIKMLKEEDADSVYSFIEEAKIMICLQHPNLVKLHGVCTQKRPIYIVTEYMQNGDLLSYLRQNKDEFYYKISSLLHMCYDVCCGMEYLESRNIIHRDLAARNCLVNEKLIVKVGDFGLSRLTKDDQYNCSMGAKFPIKWASPQVLSFTLFSSKSDVWAFGVLMWEIFTCGEMPYGKMTNKQVVDHVTLRNGRLQKPDNCPTIVYSMMSDCWQRESEQRPDFNQLRIYIENLFEQQSNHIPETFI